MKTHRLVTIVAVVLVMLAAAGAVAVYAFGMGSVDGVWEFVQDLGDEGAECDSWATSSPTRPDSPTAWSRTDPSVQTGSTTDENQVRYGRRPGYTCANTNFSFQSGLGFDGNNAVGLSLAQGTPFWLGRVSHYNRTIELTQPPNYMDWIDLDVTISGIVCGNGQPPNEGGSLTSIYRVLFDETINGGTCAYDDPDVSNDVPCPDAITITPGPLSASFTCDDEDEELKGVYTVAITGFQKHISIDCRTQIYDPTRISTVFITQEAAANHACLWAEITDFTPLAVTMASFTATGIPQGVRLDWQTVSEDNNLGFNVYRAESLSGSRIQLNTRLIPSPEPGSPVGVGYAYLDLTAKPGVEYYYWLGVVDATIYETPYGPQQAAAPFSMYLPFALGN